MTGNINFNIKLIIASKMYYIIETLYVPNACKWNCNCTLGRKVNIKPNAYKLSPANMLRESYLYVRNVYSTRCVQQ